MRALTAVQAEIHLDALAPGRRLGLGRLLPGRFRLAFPLRRGRRGRLRARPLAAARRLPLLPELAIPLDPDALADAFERRDALAGDRFEPFLQRLGVVGDQLGPVAGSRNLDVERLDRGQTGVVRFHRRDHGVDRAALERMHGRCPGAVEMAQLRIARGQREPAPVLQREGHPPVADVQDFGRDAVDDPEAGVVARPPDAVAGAKLDNLGPVDLGSALAPADLRRLPGDAPAVRAFEMDGSPLALDALDAPFVALCDPEALVGTVEGDHIAGRVVGDQRLLCVGIALRDQPLRFQCRPRDAAREIRQPIKARKYPALLSG